MSPDPWGKIRFYGTFSALGLCWAEMFNAPAAALNPLLYLFYGVIWVILLDTFVRFREDRWYVWYLGGLMLGLLLETYFAKVVFFGLKHDETRVWGLAPGPILFVVNWYHPLFSFMVPAWIAARIAGFPVPVPDVWWLRWLPWLAPILLLPANLAVTVQRCGNPVVSGFTLIVCAVVLSTWRWRLRRGGNVDTVVLSDVARRRLWWCFAATTLFGLLVGTNPDHGRGSGEFPVGPMLVMSAIIAGLGLLLRQLVRQRLPSAEPVPFDPVAAPATAWRRWFAWYFGFHLLMLALYAPLAPVLRAAIPLLGLIGVMWGLALLVVGVISAVYSVVCTPTARGGPALPPAAD